METAPITAWTFGSECPIPTGTKVDSYSLPHSSITKWSSENAGKIDLDAERELWTRAGHIEVEPGKQVDIRKLDHLISHAVLNG